MDSSGLMLLAEHEARGRLREHRLVWRLLRPPYAALGVGELRLLRLRQTADGTELIAGYDRYERLFDRPSAPAPGGS